MPRSFAGHGAMTLGKKCHEYWKRANVFPVAIVTFVCPFFYFFAVWQHGGNNTVVDVATLAARCLVPPAKEVALDFASHHSTDSSTDIATSSIGKVAAAASTTFVFEPCDVKYSEYTPCEDKDRSLRFERERLMYRERHCPGREELLRCMVPAPAGYRAPFPWPASRELAWFANVPHRELTVEKANQNWIRVEGERLRFPGGGTMFPRGAAAYIDDIARLIPLSDGSIRTAVDTGCGVASWGAYLLSRNITAMSFAPRDTHEAQVQFALERGVPAMIGIMASNRLPYPSRAFDMAHCSRCLIPWHQHDGLYLIEVDRILRPGGYWILSGPPINWKMHWKGWGRTEKDLNIEQMLIETVARSLCWKKIKEKGDIEIWRKPTNHIHCKISRRVFNTPKFCPEQDPDAAWYKKMEPCITPLPEVQSTEEMAGGELMKWPERLSAVPPRIRSGSIDGVTADTFLEINELWKKRVGRYKNLIGQLGQGRYRNLLDMNANLGGFAAALVNDPVWVMNVVPSTMKTNTLGVIYERGLIGTYQDWCEAMSTYPRTYDLLHADSIFSLYHGRCDMEYILLEMDRILRPEGAVIIRDDVDVLVNLKSITDGMRWQSQIVDHENGPFEREKILLAVKTYWTTPSSGQRI